jgi:hypothetical protein
MNFSMSQLRALRISKSGLLETFSHPIDCVSQLVGVQSQISSASALSIAFRTRNFSNENFQESLYKEKSLIRLWGQRNTLHVYTIQDWSIIVSAFRERYSWALKKFLKHGGTLDDYKILLDRLAVILLENGCLSRQEIIRELGLEVDSLICSWGGLLIDAAYRGMICDSGNATFIHPSLWLQAKKINSYDYVTANQILIKKYISAYGPVTPKDIAHWYGISLKETHKYIQQIDSSIQRLYIGHEEFLIQEDENVDFLKGKSIDSNELPPIFLYRFDPLLLAYKNKNWISSDDFSKRIWGAAGHVSGVILESGMAVGTWRYIRNGKNVNMDVSPFKRFRKETTNAIEQNTYFLRKFFGNLS